MPSEKRVQTAFVGLGKRVNKVSGCLRNEVVKQKTFTKSTVLYGKKCRLKNGFRRRLAFQAA
ncbi:hypothetical protein GCWU000324_01476 [Kingella oralis ATCC 51147]|uniref:Uncharacterized protein n=1 Tax=Kingella oralis ATCC 51147 TaxID=629741 RepID=C4GKH3_9NEIS|nr:hypothetical protein GCWU000324_01476 [Kingella oralis ATCC 51147]